MSKINDLRKYDGHSPGPWFLDRDSGYVDADGKQVAASLPEFRVTLGNTAGPKEKANGLLMLDATALLEEITSLREENEQLRGLLYDAHGSAKNLLDSVTYLMRVTAKVDPELLGTWEVPSDG